MQRKIQKGQNVKKQNGKITYGIAINHFINSWQYLCKVYWLNKGLKFISAAMNSSDLIDQGQQIITHFLFGLWAKHSFYIFKWLEKKTQQMILHNMWRLYEIRILVSRNKILLEQTCPSFTYCPWMLSFTTGRAE